MNRDLLTTVELLLGAKGTGKTPHILGDPEHNVESQLEYFYDLGYKIIILDRIYHPKYRDVPVMSEDKKEKLHLFHKGVYRIIEPVPKQMVRRLNQINENVRDAVIIYEDAIKIEKNKLSDPSTCIVANSKNLNNFVKFMYHGWKFVPLDLLPFLDEITMFKISRSIDEREMDELDEQQIQIIQNCFEEVKANPDPYFKKSISISQ